MNMRRKLNMKQTDIVIIGAGIAGLTAAIYLKRANANFVILEGKEIGGKLNELKEIENYPGFRLTTGKEIKDGLVEHAKDLGIEVINANVQSILKEPVGFEVKSDVESFNCKAVIVASGLKAKGEMIKGEKEYFGMGVSYCATCDGNFFKGQDVAVLGNNNVALEEALYLSNLVKKLYFVCPDKELVGDEKLISAIKSSNNVEILLDSKVDEIKGDDFGVTEILIKDKAIPVFGVFPYLGHKSATEFLANLKPETKNNALVCNSAMETNIPGLYGAGDIVDKKLRQLVTASSDGAIAATSAFVFVKQK